MKKYGVLLLLMLLLAACGDEETESSAPVEDQATEETEQETNETAEVKSAEETTVSTLTNENVKEVIEFNGTGEGDELISAEVDDKEVKAVIKLAPSDLLPADDFAVTRYSQVSDELLNCENWETLTVEYVDTGTISMHRSEAETNEWGMIYFPAIEIQTKLN